VGNRKLDHHKENTLKAENLITGGVKVTIPASLFYLIKITAYSYL